MDAGSWHEDFRDTSWVFVGGLDLRLSEGDVLCVVSQFGEVEDARLVRDDGTGESKGFAFVKFEDWRSTVLAVDNLNGAELLGKKLKVQHTRYEPPKLKKEEEAALGDAEKLARILPGSAYSDKEKIEIEGQYDLHNGFNAFAKHGLSAEGKQERKRSSRSHEKEDGKKRKFDRHERDKKHRKKHGKTSSSSSSKKRSRRYDSDEHSERYREKKSKERKRDDKRKEREREVELLGRKDESATEKRTRLAMLAQMPAVKWDGT